MTPSPGRQILDRLEPRRDAMVALLEELVEAESPSTDKDLQHEVLERLERACEARGLRARRHQAGDSGGILVARPAERRRGNRPQLLVGHCDTVWPRGTLERMPMLIEGGRFLGPGAYDMKAGLVQGLFAIETAREVVGGPLAVTPVLLVNSDEEIGSRQSTGLIRRLAQRVDRVFVLEPSTGLDGRLKTARKGVGRYTIRVRGRAAHAGLDPEKGASAILELSLVIQQLFAMNDHERGITVNVGTIDGGLRPNVVAPESQAVVDVRIPTREDAVRLEQQIRSLRPTTPGCEIDVEGGIGRPPMEHTPGGRRLWRRALDAARELDIPLEEATAGGGSDGNTTSQFAPTLDGLGAVGAGAHSADEFLLIDRMVERAALLACLLIQPPLRSVGSVGSRPESEVRE